ncbi:Threonine efflux protein [Marinomonas spartinae]|uniref:LysE family translocator n=1 Tax=Marinomonas spartinae TaxID=1792290 RepID=UPI0008090EDE|nr:LysE family translocator [Marinomonas spartinae]SBS32276.1 Threonine efflux protein [Marinomonas spartinae]
MDTSTFFSLATICVMGAISPGPSLAVILRVTLSQSSYHGAVAALAHGFGIGLWALFTMQGLAILMLHYPSAFHVIAMLGGLYLAWLGIKALRFAGQGSQEQRVVTSVSYWQSARDGLAIALMNPKAALFFLALFSQYINSNMGAVLKMQLWGMVFAIDTVWYLLVALLLAGGPLLRWLKRNRVWVDRIMGCLLIGLGLSIFLR